MPKKLCDDAQCETQTATPNPNPQIAQYWDYDKNTMTSCEVFATNANKLWFECNTCSHPFEISMAAATSGDLCPYCC